MKVGGSAEYFCKIRSKDDFIEAADFAKQNELALYILGGGSNVIISDNGLKGIVIKNECSCMQLSAEGEITADSGVSLSKLVNYSIDNSLGDLTFASGIPGTVGGAVYGNAGAYGKSIGEFIKSAVLIDISGNVHEVENGYFNFSYRSSSIKRKPCFIYSVTFKLEKCDKNELLISQKKIIQDRTSKHPSLSVGNSGCFFKNIDINGRRTSAGNYLDQAGAKSFKCGGASVFQKHANFIINANNASALEIYELAQKMKLAVKQNFNIELNEEIRYWGNFNTNS